MYTHWQSENGRWAIRSNFNGQRLVIENDVTGRAYTAVRYPLGSFAYDDPEQIPLYVRKAYVNVWYATR